MVTLGEINRILHVESRRHVAPLYWSTNSYDANTVKNNGSCFAVEIGATRFGVTAHHVIDKFLRIRDLDPSTRLMVRNTDISDWEDRFIDSDAGLDVATFHLTEAEILNSEIQMFRHAAEKWPPPPPQEDQGVFLMGYPGEGRRVLNKKSVEFSGVSHGVVLTSIGPEELEMRLDRKDLHNIDGSQVQSLEYDLGGFSGAPLLVVSRKLGPLFWLGGVVIRQWPPGGSQDQTTFWARRPDCICQNGHLKRAQVIEEEV